MKNIQVDVLEKFISKALIAAGLEVKPAKIVAKNISFADKQGTDTHGIMRLPIYVERLKKDLINPKPEVKWVKEAGTTAVLDGDNGMGHYSAQLAMEKAIEKADENGIGFVSLFNGNHIGAGACYSRMAADKGMIAFVTTNAGPLMAPAGGIERVLGNNPIIISIPQKNKEPISLDIANSNVAGGKLELARSKNEEIPLGWALDKEGNPTTNPDKGLEGVLLPIGGHKGYGLTMVMDILAGVLTGANYSRNIPHLYEDQPTNVGCSMFVLKIDNILESDNFYNRLDDFTNIILNSRRAPGVEKIYLPGEIEANVRKERLEEGVKINAGLYQELLEMSEDLNIDIDELS